MSVFIPFKKNHHILIGIYALTSPSGKVYVGQSWDIFARWRQYKLQNGIHNQRKLCQSLKKYGPDAHEFKILAWFSAGCTQDDLDHSERHWMAVYQALGVELLNLREAGSRGKQSLESVRRAVETRRARGSYVVSAETRAKSSARLKGKKQDAAVVAKRAATQRGQRRPGVALWNSKRSRSDEERKKQSEAKKRWWAENRDKPRHPITPYTRSEENRRKISEIKKEWWAKRRAGMEGSKCLPF